MAEIWKAGVKEVKLLMKLIKDHFPHLLLIQDEIALIYRDKAKEAPGGQVILGNTKKAPALLSVLTDKEFPYKYIIELGGDSWNELDSKQQEALLFHHLCSMKVEENVDTGEIKCQIRPPDFYGYREEVEKYGMWRPYDDETASAIESMFGKGGTATAKIRKRVADEEEETEATIEDVVTVQNRTTVDDDIDDVLQALSSGVAES